MDRGETSANGYKAKLQLGRKKLLERTGQRLRMLSAFSEDCGSQLLVPTSGLTTAVTPVTGDLASS